MILDLSHPHLQKALDKLHLFMEQNHLGIILLRNILDAESEHEAFVLLRKIIADRQQKTVLLFSSSSLNPRFLNQVLAEISQSSFFLSIEIKNILLHSNPDFPKQFSKAPKTLKDYFTGRVALRFDEERMKDSETGLELVVNDVAATPLSALQDLLQACMYSPVQGSTSFFGEFLKELHLQGFYKSNSSQQVWDTLNCILTESGIEAFSISLNQPLPLDMLPSFKSSASLASLSIEFTRVDENQQLFAQLPSFLPENLECLELCLNYLPEDQNIRREEASKLLKALMVFLQGCSKDSSFKLKLHQSVITQLTFEHQGYIKEIRELLSKTGITFSSDFFQQPFTRQNHQAVFFTVLAETLNRSFDESESKTATKPVAINQKVLL
ncbi:hypothetical protein [Legionella jordanis]|uniref:Uncharacterized protein n=1 Tax=Legionella jordanis TaxID=456 RepID=A0A0W0VA98_9GAMM|nr:hypothetical protein [Legionella jordanis]KTD17067.1 hypothetical protein Ljor_1373 [Legionella jordanis]RMX03200.1 hypothetical protein EAW55_07160 [Legionella jordanis]RMX18660.1 hypothetical protein EAS68_07535 [Legionella jordanis]VEH12736.1 Uncharacterised protein [Legionella jordanis]